MAESGERQRPRLNLKPRDEAAAAKIALERAASAKNPFGAAKPREAVLAVREGKREEDILKEDLQKDKIHLRLNGAQQREKDAAEAAIADIKQTLELEEDESKKDLLRAQVKSSEAKLEEMLSTFEKLAIEQAKSGGGIRPSALRAEQGFAQQGGGGRGGDQFGEGFGGRGGGRGGFQEGGYGNGRPGSFESGGGFGGGGRGGGGYDRGFQQDSRGGYNRGAGGYDQYGGGGGGGYDQFAAGPPDPTFDSFGGGSYGGGGGGRGRGGGRGGGGGRHQYGQGGGEEGGFGGGQDRF